MHRLCTNLNFIYFLLNMSSCLQCVSSISPYLITQTELHSLSCSLGMQLWKEAVSVLKTLAVFLVSAPHTLWHATQRHPRAVLIQRAWSVSSVPFEMCWLTGIFMYNVSLHVLCKQILWQQPIPMTTKVSSNMILHLKNMGTTAFHWLRIGKKQGLLKG